MGEEVADCVSRYLRVDSLGIETRDLLRPVVDAVDPVGGADLDVFLLVFGDPADVIVTD